MRIADCRLPIAEWSDRGERHARVRAGLAVTRVAESPPRRVNFMREAERMNVQGKDEKTGIMKTGISTEN